MKRPRKPIKQRAPIPTTSPHSNAADIKPEEIPLDLLCDMTHHLIRYKKAEDVATNGEVWEKMVQAAVGFIMHAQGVRNATALHLKLGEVQGDLKESHGKIMRHSPDVKTEEKEMGKMGFTRGCKHITGLRKKEDAERRFSLALPHLLILSDKPLKYYQKNGFTLEEAGAGKSFMRRIPKEKLRKPRETTGKYVGVHQRRIEKKLGKTKKSLAGAGGKKSPKRGGISRA
jgi:hypothetical protein